MANSKRKTCKVQVLSCKLCGTLAVSVDDYRITGHKCAGAWNVVRTERVAVATVRQALGDAPVAPVAELKGGEE
jgi:hypothetical protein